MCNLEILSKFKLLKWRYINYVYCFGSNEAHLIHIQQIVQCHPGDALYLKQTIYCVEKMSYCSEVQVMTKFF